MTTPFPALIPAARGGRTRWLAGLLAFAAALFVANANAQAPAAPGNAPPPLAAENLEALVARIALYPDDLVALILPASTNPLQMVQADRYLEKRKADPKAPLDEKWDDAVKSLLNYPEVVKSMSGDLDWTSALGEAVVEDQGAVLEAVQVFRRKTQSAGNLKTDAKQTVVVEKEVIKIVPSDPQVIYVPQYNPATVVVSGGYSSWGYYPSPYPVYYYPYPPGAALATGLIWGAAIGAAWNGNHYGANYSGGGNSINVNNSRTTNVSRTGGTASQRPAGGGSGSSQWKSNKQPGQVSSSTGRTQSARVGDTGSRGGAGGGRPSTQPAGGGRDMGGGGGRDMGGGGARPSTQPSGGAFGGSNSSGRQAQMDSSRGSASRGGSSSISGQGARQVPPSGGAGRASMGGGRSGGGAATGSRSGGGGGGGSRGGGGGGGRR